MNPKHQLKWDRREFLSAIVVSTSSATLGLQAAKPDDPQTSLFDGKTLDGWHTNRKKISHGSGGLWKVEDGVLSGEQDPPGSGNGGLLLSDRKFADFELSIDMRPDWGPCSGVFFRCTESGAGFQMYVDYHDSGNVGHLRGEMAGSFAVMPFKIVGKRDKQDRLVSFKTTPDPRAEKWPEGVYRQTCTPEQWLETWRIDDWNTARIRCAGKYPQITTWINDLQVCHFDGEKSTLPAYNKHRVFELLGRSGSIGLQIHGGKSWPKGAKCRWKHIRIREL